MLSWIVLWDAAKVMIFPIVGLLYTLIKQKITGLDQKIEKLEKQNASLEIKLVRMETAFVTHDQMRELLSDIMVNMEKGTDSLEKRIDKTMDLKIDPIKDMLSQLVNRR